MIFFLYRKTTMSLARQEEGWENSVEKEFCSPDDPDLILDTFGHVRAR